MHLETRRGQVVLLVQFLDEAVEVAELLLLLCGQLLLVVLEAAGVLLGGGNLVEDIVLGVVESKSAITSFGHSSIIIMVTMQKRQYPAH